MVEIQLLDENYKGQIKLFLWSRYHYGTCVVIGSVQIIPLNLSETYVNGFLINDATELRTGQ